MAAEKPRVLFSARYLTGNEGITSHIVTLGESLIVRGWEVAIAATIREQENEGGSGPSLFISKGFQFFPVLFPEPEFSFRNFPVFVKAFFVLNEIVRKYKPDVIHIHSLSVSLFYYILRLIYGIPVVSTCHIMPAAKRKKVKIGSFLNRHVHGLLGNRLIAIGSEIRWAYLNLFAVESEDIRLIFHGINERHFRIPTACERALSREQFGLKMEDKVVCLIGRLNLVKGHDVLIRAVKRLHSEGIDVRILIAGTGDGESRIRELVEEAGVSCLVRFTGFVEAREVLWASDVFVLPSRREAFPLSVIEAMSCGVVPVRTPAGGAYDQIQDGINGFIVPFDDDEALADRIRWLLENDACRSAIARKARETVEDKFSIDQMVVETEAVYHELTKVNIELQSAPVS